MSFKRGDKHVTEGEISTIYGMEIGYDDKLEPFTCSCNGEVYKITDIIK